MTDSAISTHQLEKRFGDVVAVNRVDLSVPPGAFLVLLGPSGCGKTTILRMLAGLETPTGGEIRFGDRLITDGARGVVVPPGQRKAGLVFQSYALWPHMTIQGNVEWPLKIARWKKPERQMRVQEVFTLLGIADLAQRYPSEISGGQQQRAAIARMIAPRPSILLFDEPLSNLDAKLRVEMRAELLRIHRTTGATSVYVTHDQVEALTMATHIAVLNAGRIEQFGSPREVLESPATAFAATFVGTPPGNLVTAECRENRYRLGALDLGAAPTGTSGQSYLLLYRPETMTVHDAPGERRLAVDFAEAAPMAGRVVVTGWNSQQRLSVVADKLPDVQVGGRLYFEFPPKPAAIYADK
ncbi:MAG: ABC transporter ATP-binding protein [Anaerolineales bacterium]|nr:ABC transporter ATP-binding protein [Anaerolineales bacterium]